MSLLQLSIIIPVFNEQARIDATLKEVLAYLERAWPHSEVVVVDDGSCDDTAAIVTRWRDGNPPCLVRLLRNRTNRGKGFSVRRGMLSSQGRWALLTDADLSCPIRELPKLVEALADKGHQIAIGSRGLAGSNIEVHQSWVRESSGKLFNLLVRTLFGLPYRDTQCGFKLFQMETCRAIFERQKAQRYAFDVELLLLARQAGLSVCEVPVVWRHSQASRVRLLRDGSHMIFSLLQIWWNHQRRF